VDGGKRKKPLVKARGGVSSPGGGKTERERRKTKDQFCLATTTAQREKGIRVEKVNHRQKGRGLDVSPTKRTMTRESNRNEIRKLL